ncbi:hypothetical protein [Nodularia spumigena]|nr:hypothetical protein [Nodularia spumigena]
MSRCRGGYGYATQATQISFKINQEMTKPARTTGVPSYTLYLEDVYV